MNENLNEVTVNGLYGYFFDSLPEVTAAIIDGVCALTDVDSRGASNVSCSHYAERNGVKVRVSDHRTDRGDTVSINDDCKKVYESEVWREDEAGELELVATDLIFENQRETGDEQHVGYFVSHYAMCELIEAAVGKLKRQVPFNNYEEEAE